MPRTARVVVSGMPHHITQRGFRRFLMVECSREFRLTDNFDTYVPDNRREQPHSIRLIVYNHSRWFGSLKTRFGISF